jgi:hypothetical protein
VAPLFEEAAQAVEQVVGRPARADDARAEWHCHGRGGSRVCIVLERRTDGRAYMKLDWPPVAELPPSPLLFVRFIELARPETLRLLVEELQAAELRARVAGQRGA